MARITDMDMAGADRFSRPLVAASSVLSTRLVRVTHRRRGGRGPGLAPTTA